MNRSAALGIAAALIVPAALAQILAIPGHLTIDDTTFYLMAKALSRGSMAIENGFGEVASDELQLATYQGAAFVRSNGAALYGRYPILFPLMAAPFAAVQGYLGLFTLNALGFGLSLILTHRLAARLTGDPRIALLTCALFALTTFAFEYALASWPHAVVLPFVLGALLLGLRAADPEEEARAPRWALLAGGVVGLGVAVRFDTLLVAPAIGLLILSRPRWLALSLAFAAGLLPGLGLMSWANHVRFFTWFPLSYGVGGGYLGHTAARFSPAVGIAVGILAARLAWARSPALRAWRPGGRAVALAVVGGLALALAVAPLRGLALKLATGLAALVVDLRLLDPADKMAAARGPAGEVLFIGGIKKALLQSVPYLSVGLIPLARAAQGDVRARRLLPAVFAALTFVLAYSVGGWHGGLCLNLRYLLPTLPLFCLLAAWGAAEAAPHVPRGGWAAAAALGVGALAFFFYTLRGGPADGPEAAWWVQVAPLGLAALGAIAAGGWLLTPSRATAALVGVSLAMGGGYGAAVAFGYDLPLSQRWRAADLATADAIHAALEPGALLFATPFGSRMNLYGREGLTVADPNLDKFDDFRRLTGHWLAAGRPVYALLPEVIWDWLAANNLLQGLRVEPGPAFGGVTLGRLQPEGG